MGVERALFGCREIGSVGPPNRSERAPNSSHGRRASVARAPERAWNHESRARSSVGRGARRSRRARADEDALAGLYDRFGRVAYGLALRIVRDPALAEDAVQEGFLAVWRSAARFVTERAKASTWILT